MEAPEFERMLVYHARGCTWTKFWFSTRDSGPSSGPEFVIRRGVDPVRQWKLSPMDIQSLDKWDDYTEAKEAMFFYTDTADAPWTVVKSNDKKRARLEAMRHILAKFDYEGKDEEVVGKPDRKIIGSRRRCCFRSKDDRSSRSPDCEAALDVGENGTRPRSSRSSLPRPSCTRRSAGTPRAAR